VAHYNLVWLILDSLDTRQYRSSFFKNVLGHFLCFCPYLHKLGSAIGVRDIANINKICVLSLSRYNKSQTRSKPEKRKWASASFLCFPHVKLLWLHFKTQNIFHRIIWCYFNSKLSSFVLKFIIFCKPEELFALN